MTGITLYAIEEELEALLDSVDTCPDELRAELEERIAQYLGAEAAKVDRIAWVLSTYDHVQVHAKAEIERLRQRQQAAEKNARRLEHYILAVIRQRDGKPLRGMTNLLYMGRSEALIIDDADAVPERFKRSTIVVDVMKTPAKEAIRGGETIPGVHIETRESLARR